MTDMVSSRRQRKIKLGHKKSTTFLSDTFKAATIDPERLTLSRKTGRGLFSKGKSALVIEGCDLPDLTFSNMTSLSQRKRRGNTNLQQTRCKKVKEQRSGQGVLEICNYFSNQAHPCVSPHRNLQLPNIQPQAPTSTVQSFNKSSCQPSANIFMQPPSIAPPQPVENPLLVETSRQYRVSSYGSRDRPRAIPGESSDRSFACASKFLPPNQTIYREDPRINSEDEFIHSSEETLRLPRFMSPEGYTRAALIGEQPGFWKGPRGPDETSSIASVADLHRILDDNATERKKILIPSDQEDKHNGTTRQNVPGDSLSPVAQDFTESSYNDFAPRSGPDTSDGVKYSSCGLPHQVSHGVITNNTNPISVPPLEHQQHLDTVFYDTVPNLVNLHDVNLRSPRTNLATAGSGYKASLVAWRKTIIPQTGQTPGVVPPQDDLAGHKRSRSIPSIRKYYKRSRTPQSETPEHRYWLSYPSYSVVTSSLRGNDPTEFTNVIFPNPSM